MNNFDQTVIERAISEVIRTLGVSANVFNNRPRSSDKNLKDFVVCKVVGAIRDFSAFGMCTVSVQLFAQDAAGMKNGEKLPIMQGKIKERMSASVGDMILDITGVEPIGDTPDKNGYHIRIIQLKKVIIKIV